MASGSNFATAEPALEIRVSLPMTTEELRARVDAAIDAKVEKVAREELASAKLITAEEAVRLLAPHWTPSGFLRVANRENLPYVKGPHKAERSYRQGEVIKMLERLQVWPKGKPVPAVIDFPQTPNSSAA